jgi:hypothetical protein
LIGFITGHSSDGSLPAYATAIVNAILNGGTNAVVVNSGVSGKPRSFFIGLGSSYTTSTLYGAEKEGSQTVGGSGLIGFTAGWQNLTFYYTLAVYRRTK